MRQDVLLVDERGRQSRGSTNQRILELEHVSTLFVLVAAIAENGGRPVRVSKHGAILERKAELGRVPFLPVKRLPQLRRNDYLTVEREGADFLVGLGERARRLAAKWEIDLPEA